MNLVFGLTLLSVPLAEPLAKGRSHSHPSNLRASTYFKILGALRTNPSQTTRSIPSLTLFVLTLGKSRCPVTSFPTPSPSI